MSHEEPTHEEPIVEITPVSSKQARRFLLQFSFVFILCSVFLVLASIYSNHYGYFGDYGQFEFYNDRLAKVRYIKQIPDSQMPEAFILGSSDTLPFQPARVEELFGMKTFNLGNYWGRVEDIWAWTNFLLKTLHTKPKMFIIGLEPWTFSASQLGPPLLSEYGHTLIMVDELAQYLPLYSRWKYELCRIFNSFTLQNIRTTLRMSLRYKLERKERIPLEKSTFNIDGTNKVYNIRIPEEFLPVEVNQFYKKLLSSPTPESLAEEHKQLLDRELVRLDQVANFLPGDIMDPEDLALLEKIVALCKENNIQVGFVMLPVHPYYFDTLLRKSRHALHLEQLHKVLTSLKEKFTNVQVIIDASDYRKFPLNPADFCDLYHMTPNNADIILAKLKEQWGKQQ